MYHVYYRYVEKRLYIRMENNRYSKIIETFNNSKPQIQMDGFSQYSTIKELLEKNKATKATAKKLGEFIADADDRLQVLVLGDIHTSKSNFINGLLNRELLPVNKNGCSFTNSIIRYGEEEGVTAYFFDGQIAKFETSQIELFTVSDTFSSQLMRDGLDYLEIVINNDFLKTVTLFDTPSYRKSVFIKESFLGRSQVTLWLTNKQFRGMPSERALVKTIQRKQNELLFLYDYDQSNTNKPLPLAEEAIFKQFNSIKFSIDDLLLAQKNNDEKGFENANIDELLAYLQSARLTDDRLIELRQQQFLDWADRFILELKGLTERAPFSDAFLQLVEFQQINQEQTGNLMAYNKRKQQIDALELAYETLQKKYNAMTTAQDLIRLIKEYELATVRKVNQFILDYKNYEKQLIDYKNQRIDQAVLLETEAAIKTLFSEIKNDIYKLVQKKLLEIEQSILDTQSISEYKKYRLDNASRKLKGFNPIVEAKAEVLAVLQQFPENERSRELSARLMDINLNYKNYIEFYDKQFTLQEANSNSNVKHTVYKDILEKLKIVN